MNLIVYRREVIGKKNAEYIKRDYYKVLDQDENTGALQSTAILKYMIHKP